MTIIKAEIPKQRHEIKHLVNYEDFVPLLKRLRAVMKPDAHAGLAGFYRVRSLYFDNLQDKALREKLDSVSQREKFRIRFYNEDTSYIRLEKKTKDHGLGVKRSAALSREECQRILAGDIQWLRDREDPLLVEFYGKMQFQQLKPKTIVDYLRYPFTYDLGNVRITLDTDIRTGLYSKDLFRRNLPLVSAGREFIVLEVKYDEFLPGLIQDLIQVPNRRPTAFSKYAVCRVFG